MAEQPPATGAAARYSSLSPLGQPAAYTFNRFAILHSQL